MKKTNKRGANSSDNEESSQIDVTVECVKNSQCPTNFCAERHCAKARLVGDSCSISEKSNMCPKGLKCDSYSSTCVAPTFTFNRINCSSQSDCQEHEYCEGSKCVERKPLAEACLKNKHCEDGLVCLDYTCQKKCIYGSKKFACEENAYYCSRSSICTPKSFVVISSQQHPQARRLQNILALAVIGMITVMLMVFIIILISQFLEKKRKKRKETKGLRGILKTALTEADSSFPSQAVNSTRHDPEALTASDSSSIINDSQPVPFMPFK